MTRVLIVEDEPAIAELIALNVRHAGYEVAIAADGEQAQAHIDRVLPDVVLLDWMLPGRSGLALAAQWRADARTRAMAVIMLTARAAENDRVGGLDAGADDYLTKPFSTGASSASGALRRSTARMRASSSLVEKGLVR